RSASAAWRPRRRRPGNSSWRPTWPPPISPRPATTAGRRKTPTGTAPAASAKSAMTPSRISTAPARRQMPTGSLSRDRPAAAARRRIRAACHTAVTPQRARSANDLTLDHNQAAASRCHDLAEETPAGGLAETNGVRPVLHTVAAAASRGPGEEGPSPALRPVPGEGDHLLAGARKQRSGRTPGGVLVAVAMGLLFLLGAGLFAVSLDAQYRYVFHAKHQSAASWIEALALDVGMAIFSLLALGLARAGKPARAERVLITVCAAASGVMNFAAANDTSLKSVLAYVMPPVFLAVVADRVVSVVRRHVLGEHERSPWLAAAPLILYLVRLV